MPRNWRITREFEIFYCLNLNLLTESIKRGLIMQPSVPMKHLFILLRDSKIICGIMCVAGTVDDFECLFAFLISDELKNCLRVVLSIMFCR